MSILFWILSGLVAFGVVVQLYLFGGGALFAYGFWTGVVLAALLGGFAAYRRFLPGAWNYVGWSVAGLAFLVLVPYCFYALVLLPLNYPPGQPFEEKLVVKSGTEPEKENFYRLDELLKLWGERYNEVTAQVDGDVEPEIEAHELNERTLFVVDRSDTTRSKLLDFYAENRTAFPEKELHPEGKVPRLVETFKLFDLELIAIKQALREDRLAEAKKRYLRVWAGLRNSTGSQSSIIKHLVNLALISRGVQFYASNPGIRSLVAGTKFVSQLESTRSNLRTAVQKSLAYEYTVMSETLDLTRGGERTLQKRLNQLVSGSWFSTSVSFGGFWPIYDYWKSRRKMHDFYYRLAELSSRDFYKVSDRLREEEELIINKLERWSQPGLAHLENPVGKVLIAAAFPQIFDMIFNTAKARSKLDLLAWVHETRPNFEQAEVPSDELTGEPYELNTTSDSFVVRSPYAGDRNSGDPVQIEFEK